MTVSVVVYQSESVCVYVMLFIWRCYPLLGVQHLCIQLDKGMKEMVA